MASFSKKIECKKMEDYEDGWIRRDDVLPLGDIMVLAKQKEDSYPERLNSYWVRVHISQYKYWKHIIDGDIYE